MASKYLLGTQMLDQTNRMDELARLAESLGYKRTAMALQRLGDEMRTHLLRENPQYGVDKSSCDESR
jgi:hypothetical protein